MQHVSSRFPQRQKFLPRKSSTLKCHTYTSATTVHAMRVISWSGAGASERRPGVLASSTNDGATPENCESNHDARAGIHVEGIWYATANSEQHVESATAPTVEFCTLPTEIRYKLNAYTVKMTAVAKNEANMKPPSDSACVSHGCSAM
eukprot:1796128-Prymnesium_polylepis.1